MIKLNKIFNNYLSEINNTGNSELFIIRNDGLLMASNSTKEDMQSTAALATGIWQAAEATYEDKNSVGECSLSFATTDTGLFLLPLEDSKRSFYLCCRYEGELNPGHLKQKLKNHRNILLETLSELTEEIENTRSEYLFPDLTDQEINKIFSAVEMK